MYADEENAWSVISRSEALIKIRKKVVDNIKKTNIEDTSNEVAYLLGMIDALGGLTGKI